MVDKITLEGIEFELLEPRLDEIRCYFKECSYRGKLYYCYLHTYPYCPLYFPHLEIERKNLTQVLNRLDDVA